MLLGKKKNTKKTQIQTTDDPNNVSLVVYTHHTSKDVNREQRKMLIGPNARSENKNGAF